jgi:biotin operon repressor
MHKKHTIRLTEEEHAFCWSIINTEKERCEAWRRAAIILNSDLDGPSLGGQQIAEALGCSLRTVEKVQQAFVEKGVEAAVVRKKRGTPPTPKRLDAGGETRVAELLARAPPDRHPRWTPRLLAAHLVALGVVDAISPATVRRTLKTLGSPGRESLLKI